MRLFLCPFGACGAQKWLFRGVRGVALSKRFFSKTYLRNYAQICNRFRNQKQKIINKKKKKMRKRNFLVKRFAKDVQIENQDLRNEFALTHRAEREMSTMKKMVSPQLYGMLVQQLLGFHANMQVEMAEDLVIFTCQSLAHSTGCSSADMVLDVCYTWIAAEQGKLKKGFREYLLNNI